MIDIAWKTIVWIDSVTGVYVNTSYDKYTILIENWGLNEIN